MGSVERQGLPPIGTKGASISPEDATNYARDLLDDYFNGPTSYFFDGPQKSPRDYRKSFLNGIYDPGKPNKAGTLVSKLDGIQSRVNDPTTRLT